MCGLAIAATIRGVISAAGIRSLRCTLADDDVEPGEQRRLLVERAVVEDVHLDAGQDAERRAARVVERGDDVQLLLQPLGATARWRRSAAASGR